MGRLEDIYRVPNADSEDPATELRLTLAERFRRRHADEPATEHIAKRFKGKPVRSMGGKAVKLRTRDRNKNRVALDRVPEACPGCGGEVVVKEWFTRGHFSCECKDSCGWHRKLTAEAAERREAVQTFGSFCSGSLTIYGLEEMAARYRERFGTREMEFVRGVDWGHEPGKLVEGSWEDDGGKPRE